MELNYIIINSNATLLENAAELIPKEQHKFLHHTSLVMFLVSVYIEFMYYYSNVFYLGCMLGSLSLI